MKPKFLAEKLTSGYFFVRSMFIRRRTPESPIPPPRPVDLHFRTYSQELEASKGMKERGGGRGNRRSSPWSESSRYSSQFSSHKSSVVSRKSSRKSSQLSRNSTPQAVDKKAKKGAPRRPNQRKTSVFAGLQRFARRKSSVGPGVNAEHLTTRKPIKLKGARKYLSGMQNSPSLKQRMQIYKSKVSSDQTVNNYVPQKKVRKWKPPVVAAYKPSPNSLPHTKNGAVKQKAAIFENKNLKKRAEDQRVRQAELKTKSLAKKAKASQMSPYSNKTKRTPGKQKPTWSPSSATSWSPRSQQSAETVRDWFLFTKGGSHLKMVECRLETTTGGIAVHNIAAEALVKEVNCLIRLVIFSNTMIWVRTKAFIMKRVRMKSCRKVGSRFFQRNGTSTFMLIPGQKKVPGKSRYNDASSLSR